MAHSTSTGASEDFTNVRLATLGGIPYKLVEGYPVYEEDRDSCSGEEEYIILASQVDAFLEEVMPQPNLLVGVPVLAITRRMPGYDWMMTAKVRVEPLDKTRPIDPYAVDAAAPADTYGPLARVHIWYDLQSQDDEDAYEISFNAGAEYLQVPPENIEVSENPEFSDPANDPNNPANPAYVANKDPTLSGYKLIPTIEWNYKLRQAFEPTFATYFALLGKVNSVRRAFLCQNAVAETVLFSGLSGTRTYRSYRRRLLGSSWHLDFKFSQRIITEPDAGGVARTYGWNHVYVPNPKNNVGEWRKLKRKNSGLFLYETTNLALQLFGTA